jgi:hypothetical protein
VIGHDSRTRWIVLIASSAALVGLGLFVEARGAFPLLRFGIQRTPKLAPSTVVLPVAELRRKAPTVSLYLRPDDLYSPKSGILANKMRHGRAWERQGWISFFEGGELTYTASTGVRVHGGGSRLTSPRQGFRLFFRRAYGAKELPAGIAFQGAHAHPLRRLIIHNDVRPGPRGIRWHFLNPLAYDIADAAGGIVAETRPVRFFLNGEFQGVYVLTEHFDSDEFFKTHWGHAVRLNVAEFEELWQQLKALGPPRMRTVGTLVDLDNLTRWFVATVFCATGDPFQGPGQFRDPTRATAQWFFVNWDMDQSFREPQHDTFGAMLGKGGSRRTRRATDPRSYLLTALLDDDPEYREYFKRVWVDVMNHRITAAFLDERFDYYAKLANDLGIEDLAYLTPLKRFLQTRPDVVRGLAENRLHTGPSVRVRIGGSGGGVAIDGHPVGSGWEGYYFPGMRIRFSVDPARRSDLAGWRVNERDTTGANLELVADGDRTIAPVWRGVDPTLPPTQ